MFFPYRDDVPLRRMPVVTYALVAVNVLVLLLVGRLPEADQELAAFHYGFVPASVEQFFTGKPLEIEIPVEINVPFVGIVKGIKPLVLPAERGRILESLFTSMFMHGNWLHLLGNMWFLWLFGNNVEDRMGRVTYIAFYLLGGLAALACHWLHDPASTMPVIGASGAVAAVLGAYVVTWPHARIRTLVVLIIFITSLELPAILVLGGWFVLQLIEALEPAQFGVAESVAWWAHIGGFIAGMLLMPVLKRFGPPMDDDGLWESYFHDDRFQN